MSRNFGNQLTAVPGQPAEIRTTNRPQGDPIRGALHSRTRRPAKEASQRLGCLDEGDPGATPAGPFTQAEAKRLGVSARMLMGKRFVRIYPRVHRAASHEMSNDDWIAAAALALPSDARLTGISRIQKAGLDFGPLFPVRFVVARDHHLDLENIFLHRTKVMPACDDTGVTNAAAFIAYCALARVVDAIKVGDWLLHHGKMTSDEVERLALAELWRPGGHEAIWVLPHLDAESRSLPESETRAVLTFAGLPRPQANRLLRLDDGVVVMGDLLFAEWRTIVEYEGSQHQEDRKQYTDDIDSLCAHARPRDALRPGHEGVAAAAQATGRPGARTAARRRLRRSPAALRHSVVAALRVPEGRGRST